MDETGLQAPVAPSDTLDIGLVKTARDALKASVTLVPRGMEQRDDDMAAVYSPEATGLYQDTKAGSEWGNAKPKGSVEAVDALVSLSERSLMESTSEARGPEPTQGHQRRNLPVISPLSRESSAQGPGRTPPPILPAIQTPSSPVPGSSQTSPNRNAKPHLPPISKQLKQLADAASRKSGIVSDARGNGSSPHRQPFASTGDPVPERVPPKKSSRPPGDERSKVSAPYPLSHSHQQFTHHQSSTGSHSPTQTSPVERRETSPNEQFRQTSNLATMSPPPRSSHIKSSSYYYNRRPPQPSTDAPSFVTRPPPEALLRATALPDGRANGRTTSPEMALVFRREEEEEPPPRPPVRQQTQTTASSSGDYKCTFPGCIAAPFQTQYLLK